MLISNCFTREECSNLEKAFFNYTKEINCLEESDGSLKNSEGFVTPFEILNIKSDITINRLTKIVKEHYSNIIYSHSYIRVYRNDSYLKAHTDAPGRDVTITVNVGGIEDWPIYFSNIRLDYHLLPRNENYNQIFQTLKKDSYSVLTPRGWGYMADGLHYPHWRETLKCKENEYVLQLFFHWVKL